MANGLVIDVSSNMPRRVGRKEFKLTPTKSLKFLSVAELISAHYQRLWIFPNQQFHRWIKEGLIRPHSNALKPYLSKANKRVRIQFCLSMLEASSLQSQPFFKNMYNYVHIDEKWFYLSKESEQYYLLPEENEPLRTCKSKRFITEVIFLAAVASPQFDVIQNQEFSSKIGIFPFTYKEPARRSSKNRSAGTLETKAIVSVTKDIFRSCLIEKVLPAISSKWPRCGVMETIYIQQDNAKPHIDLSDAEFLEAACKDGFDIRLSFQPPNSPDMNVLDLKFFRAIQSLQHQEAPTTIDELVGAVGKSFEELSSESLNHVFLSLQACMIKVMKVHGGNNYKLPHLGKGQLMRDNNLPSQLHCEREVLENAMAYLQQ